MRSRLLRDYEVGDMCASVQDFLQDIYQLVWLVTLCYVIYKTNGAWSRLKVTNRSFTHLVYLTPRRATGAVPSTTPWSL